MDIIIDNISIIKYPVYQYSGYEWLGNIPEEWELKKVKNVFRLVIDPAPKNNNYELLSVYTDIGVKPRRELEERGNKASTTDGYWFVKKGDIVVNKLLAWMGAIGISDYDGVTSPAYDILRAKIKISGSYFHYLFRNEVTVSELKRHSRGIMDMRLRLYFDKFGDIFIPFPSLKEQTAIASFLDKKTALIDQAIEIKQKQIELLKERKQILIQKAVTQGLRSNVKFKDSGVEWIGEIPGHWKVTRFKYISTIKKGKLPRKIVSTPEKDLPVYMSMEYLRGGEENQWVYDKDAKIIPEDQTLLLWDGSNAGEFIKSRKGVISSTVAEIDFSNIDKNFAWYYSKFLEIEIRKKTIGMGIPHVNGTDLKNLPVLIPPIKEQIQIVEYIDNIIGKITLSTTLKEKEIDKLKEYKSTLINSAVTGKIKVC